jgi:tight adherence protein B
MKKLEYRIGKYTYLNAYENNYSIMQGIREIYLLLVDKMSTFLYKFKFIRNYSKRYNKYLVSNNNKEKNRINFISKKIYLGLFLTIISLIVMIKGKMNINVLFLIIIFIFGFYIYDFLLIYRYYKRKKSIEENLINAIMLMNNSFRTGKSLLQAIKIVSEELDGPIANEFSKMYEEINDGLSVEVVFDRFLKRTNVKEIEYVASSLCILSKTGGNIIRVFDSIEKTLINKKEYEKEKEALTASSKLLIKFLLVLPFVIFFSILFIDNTYFSCLFTTIPGLCILLFIILDYIVYFIVVNKVLRVRV